MFFNIFFPYIKVPRLSSAKYYQKNKKRFQKEDSERYQDVSEEEMNILQY